MALGSMPGVLGDLGLVGALGMHCGRQQAAGHARHALALYFAAAAVVGPEAVDELLACERPPV
jgi:hypothetical protein